MVVHYKTRLTTIGPEVADLAEGGVLILFAAGAPPELAEVSVLHAVETSAGVAPPTGASIEIGALKARITAIGDTAWKKVADIGHVVITFNGASSADRPGEICAEQIDGATLVAALTEGAQLTIVS
jgi:PTS system glucitol/sorbitol-specific IIA component